MRRDFAQPLRIASLAEESGMSLSKFERLVRNILRVSPRQFLTHPRIEAAADRLRDSDESMGQVAIECGFYDQASFSHQFKATTGMTGSQYRRWSRDENTK